MALEAVVYPQDPISYNCKEFHTFGGGGACNYDFDLQENKPLPPIFANNNIEPPSVIMQHAKEWDPNSSSPENCKIDQHVLGRFPSMEPLGTATTGKRKRRRTNSSKNKEDMENQRMTHIAVERNRRKQMNEYLAVLRSLMPPSYVQRGDQASIIGGAIDFVKELEQLLQSMEAHKRTNKQLDTNAFSSPFADFFTFPQYSTRATHCNNSPAMANESIVERVADIEVTMVESHANLKILLTKQPRQLLKMVAGFQGLRLSILHLNVTTVEQLVLYSVSVKIEEGCHLNTVDEIATAVNQMIGRMQEEASFS